MLANEGYDVWVGNNRGNVYGRKHAKYDVRRDAPKFFDYSFYENGKYDTAAQIDFALQMSGQPKITYIGHSQGTTQMFAALADSPQFDDKIDLFIAYAPVVYLDDQQEHSASKWSVPLGMSKMLGIYEINNKMMDANKNAVNGMSKPFFGQFGNLPFPNMIV